jgi:hypothetical protein
MSILLILIKEFEADEMALTKKHIDIVTKICDSRKEGKRTSYLAKTTFFDGRRYYTNMQ